MRPLGRNPPDLPPRLPHPLPAAPGPLRPSPSGSALGTEAGDGGFILGAGAGGRGGGRECVRALRACVHWVAGPWENQAGRGAADLVAQAEEVEVDGCLWTRGDLLSGTALL